MQTLEQIRDDAARVLLHVLSGYAKRNPVGDIVAIACECDPGASSLYIHLANSAEQLLSDPMTWPKSNLEQQYSEFDPPSWFAEFDDLNSQYFKSSNDDESGYAEIEQYFATILDGVAIGILSLKHELVKLQYPDDIKLAVVTEDDDSETTMYDRVNAHLQSSLVHPHSAR